MSEQTQTPAAPETAATFKQGDRVFVDFYVAFVRGDHIGLAGELDVAMSGMGDDSICSAGDAIPSGDVVTPELRSALSRLRDDHRRFQHLPGYHDGPIELGDWTLIHRAIDPNFEPTRDGLADPPGMIPAAAIPDAAVIEAMRTVTRHLGMRKTMWITEVDEAFAVLRAYLKYQEIPNG